MNQIIPFFSIFTPFFINYRTVPWISLINNKVPVPVLAVYQSRILLNPCYILYSQVTRQFILFRLQMYVIMFLFTLLLKRESLDYVCKLIQIRNTVTEFFKFPIHNMRWHCWIFLGTVRYRREYKLFKKERLSKILDVCTWR